MQQIVEWLEKLGLSEYAQRFAENRIDLSVLPDLTDQHLKDLGVALGDRLKMLRAIGELTGAPAAASKCAPGTRQDDRSDGRIPSQPRQRLKQAFHDGRRERVQPFRSVECQHRDAVRDSFEKMLFHGNAP
jgi:hypothetical protein